ncbi:MAG: choice-of-anchor L domain-containing protein [Xanthobacteraceae bacterium]
MAITSFSPNDLVSIFKLPAGTAVSLTGQLSATALSTASLANFSGDATDPFLILSTGIASQIANANTSGGQGTDLGAFGTTDDKITLSFTMTKPVGAKAFTFDFTFLSEEYPEFVGSAFNDFLSVKVNGVEAALDTLGKSISVNNNFFTTEFAPIGTFFDGQTPPLTITVPINEAATTVNVVIEITDVGDGIYDSAAFLSSFGFAKVQVIYVDFDAGFLGFPSFLGLVSGFNLPASGLTEPQQIQILADVNAIYDDFLIEFTQTKPTSGEYSTIHIGGSVSNLPFYLNAKAGLLGRAEKIDFGNKDKSDAAFVLSGSMTSGGVPNVGLITQVLAHEAGHILGLRHVDDIDPGGMELMFPYAHANRRTIGGLHDLGEIDQDTGLVDPIGGSQNSYAELTRNLGLEQSSNLITSKGFFDQILKFVNFDLNSTLPTLFKVKLVVATSDNEVISVKDIGNVAGAASTELLIPAFGQDKVVLIAKSTATGPYDTFITPSGIKNFKPTTAGDDDILATLGVLLSSLGSGSLNVMKSNSSGTLTKVGTVSTASFDLGNNGGTEGADVFVGANNKADAFAGLGGNDKISGLAGNDRLFGNAGNDVLDGGLGSDQLFGGTGNDTFIINSTGDRLQDAGGVDQVRSFITKTLASEFEKLALLGSKAINGTGNALGNAITGNSAKNVLNGVSGNDTLQGGSGNDTLIGGTGNDILIGGAGSDKLTGGRGRDTMTGGAGADDFDYNLVSDTGRTSSTRDIIRDFTHRVDDIDLASIDANGSAAGSGAFKFLAAEGGRFTGAKGQLRWDQQNSSGTANDKTIVEGDINGDKKADFQIQLAGLKTLSAVDFIL